MKIRSHSAGQFDSFFLCSFCNFISGGIHDHTWMIVIFLHHIFKVLLPPFIQISCIVIFCLMNIPDIYIFVHHQHSLTVTGIQHVFGTRIMRRTDCIIAILFEDTDSSFFRFRISAGSKHTIIMMYAGSSEDFPLTVDRKTFFRIPFKKSDSKCFLYNIFSKCCTQSIKIRMITVPELCVRNFHTENRRVSGIFNLLCKNTILFIQDLCFHPAQAGSFYFYLDHCRCIADRMDLDSIYRNVLLITCPEIYRAVDSCSGIPAAVWLVRIPCDHADFILCFVFQKSFRIYIEICITIWSVCGFLSINIDFCIMINTFKLNENFFAAVL